MRIRDTVKIMGRLKVRVNVRVWAMIRDRNRVCDRVHARAPLL